MKTKVYLIAPPFTQLNTPYPATAYLKGFLNTLNIDAYQSDLGIKTTLKLFSSNGLKDLFNRFEENEQFNSENSDRIFAMRDSYISTIDLVIGFLQGKNPMLAHAINSEHFLPEASRFASVNEEDLEWAFGQMGIQEMARHKCTLYLEDLSDFIKAEVDEHFGFTRYAERLGRSANSFDELYEELNKPDSFTDAIMLKILEEEILEQQPNLVVISVPFPGNLYSGLKCGQWIKNHYPDVKIAFGGGFANTELRSLNEPRLFEFVDFVALDDGEITLHHIIEHVENKRSLKALKRTFYLENGVVIYGDGSLDKDIAQADLGTPDYSDLPLRDYISIIEIANPMHSLWGNGRWNKLTLAHGCYWGKCTFCDTSLDYIKRYEQTAAPLLCDRIETLIEQTGETGFHFVDEAAPPALLRDLAIDILKRDLKISWWTNIRFEKTFSADLCRLLKASGCIAMSGGLEVASDRLLKLIDKGVTVEQVVRVCNNFTEAGILVHAYLMYGYPTQTAQETMDSLEMVRQLFEAGIVQSGFWHRFAMTAHSPVGMNPEEYKSIITTPEVGSFANNDLEYEEMDGIDHGIFAEGLRISLYNYMHGAGFDMRLQDWFEDFVPKPKVSKNLIYKAIETSEPGIIKPISKVIWIGGPVQFKDYEMLIFSKQETYTVMYSRELGHWLKDNFNRFSPSSETLMFKILEKELSDADLIEKNAFLENETFQALMDLGLLIL